MLRKGTFVARCWFNEIIWKTYGVKIPQSENLLSLVAAVRSALLTSFLLVSLLNSLLRSSWRKTGCKAIASLQAKKMKKKRKIE